ncbi:PaaI family thioesterase [Halorubrum sp. DTA98]|uniref:PaaI family thioesterase n=1 Tax=Halorubrum sp. DTA98 TaxID=3402163 RepID=UPI003AAFDE11
MTADDPILDYFNRSPYREHLDIEVTAAADGHAEGELSFAEKHSSSRNRDVGQGGVAFSLADSVGGAAATSLVGVPTPTIDFRIDYLAPATTDLVATAAVVRDGRETAVVDVEVVDIDGTDVALGRGVYKTGDLPGDAPWDIDQGE